MVIRVRPVIVPGDGDPRHGTPNGYANLSCRGDCECTAAWTAYLRTRTARKRYSPEQTDGPPEQVTPGDRST